MGEEAIMEKPLSITLFHARKPLTRPARTARSLTAARPVLAAAAVAIAILETLASLSVASAAAPARAGRPFQPQAQAQPQAKPLPAPPEAKLPDTPAGRIAAEFVKVFNTGTDQEFLQFFARNGGAATLRRRTDEDRLRMNRRMKDHFGRLTVRSLSNSSPDAITLQVESEKAGWASLEFTLEPGPSHKLDSIMVNETSGPEPAAQPAPSRPAAAAPLSDDELRRRIDTFAARVEAFGFAGGVFVARSGRVILEKSCGLADRARGIPITSVTAFDIGSNTKDFTKMAILQLAERGKIGLDDPITKYFDGVPPDKVSITIAGLMDHTAGFPLYSGPDDEVITKDDFLKRILAAKLVAPPGREENYSNPGYSLLAAVIEKLTGQSYEQYVNEHIFNPAGMSQTGYALPKWKPGQLARAYSEGQDTGSTFDLPHAPDGPYWNLRGNGGTLATLDDMYKFHRALEGERLLGKESKERLFPQTEPVVLVGGNGIHYFVYHREPGSGLALLIASTDSGMRAMDMDRALTAIAKGREVELPPTVSPLPAEAVARFAGTYALPSGASFDVSSLKDRLAVVAVGQDAANLLTGLGPEAVAEAERLNARALIISEASGRGDYGPLAEAFGGRMPPGELKARNEKTRHDREAKFGPFRSVKVLGSVVAPRPLGQRTTMGPAESSTVIQIEHERGSVYLRFLWGEGGLMGVRQFDAPPAAEFRPVSKTEFASYNLSTGARNEVGFELGPDGRVTGLSLGEGAMRAIAKRTAR
jgi:CubicO group peptidase (beta-lactamase class C family)